MCGTRFRIAFPSPLVGEGLGMRGLSRVTLLRNAQWGGSADTLLPGEAHDKLFQLFQISLMGYSQF